MTITLMSISPYCVLERCSPGQEVDCGCWIVVTRVPWRVILLIKLPISNGLLSLSPIMFSVKATYNSETRKFTFNEHSFPTFNQLTSQVGYRLSLVPYCSTLIVIVRHFSVSYTASSPSVARIIYPRFSSVLQRTLRF